MEIIKKLIPKPLLKVLRPIYHGLLAVLATVYYGNPSGKMIVVGITGTAGKSTTAGMLSRILNKAGRKTGYMTTINFFDGEKDYINKHGLSMPGGPRLQRQLRQMLNKGCKYAIVECTSEGLAQNRHLGIKFDAALFTNLTEAHLEAHGGFDMYKDAKGKLFKTLNAKQSLGIMVVNLDDDNAEYFLNFQAKKKLGISFNGKSSKRVEKVYNAAKTAGGFELEEIKFGTKLAGEFNKYNALLASACANVLGIELQAAAYTVTDFVSIRGRMEPVPNNRGIKIYVDYGCEPASFKAALLAAKQIPHRRIIHVFGSTGGHRDKKKRFEFGKTSADFASHIIITNDDVYNTDPGEIAENIEEGVKTSASYKLKVVSYQIILDRKEAISKAIALAEKDDLILITGKGSEQFLVLPGNKRIEWDDVSVVRETLYAKNLD